jgi:predicted phage gp36 major capsid-like protein
MDAHKRLTQAASTWLNWLVHCWTLRACVRDLAAAFAASPTHVEINDLKAAKDMLELNLDEAVQEIQAAKDAADKAAWQQNEKYAKLKANYDARIHGTKVEQVEALKNELAQERDARHLLKIEMDKLKSDAAAHEAEHKLARDGNRALLRFIHTGHRLNVKFDPDSIRAALKK